MNYGLYISASAMSTNMARQDTLSNNLANVNTVGFKPDLLAFRQRDPARIEDGLMSLPSNELLERLGAGVMPMPTAIRMAQAPLQQTGRELDVALEGEGFLVVRAGAGAEGLRLTRDGRLAIASDGTIVTSTEGRPVLGSDGRPMQVNPRRTVEIGLDGRISQGGQEVGRLQLARVADPEHLVKAGANLLRARPGDTLQLLPAGAIVQQGHVETSGTNAIDTMVAVTSASRAVQSNARIMGYINEIMGAAVNRLGRVN